ncbi:hypothetical protein ALC60_02995 [Trachymyrmex zeteki]|uniref:Uncharacterized protein n=1 Tax=Mycetomoellerius zeteki TaxID=64791 RepID=A0A151XC30_9HYME|nr:hypothetical protein ALC60_02995 [Trachymyrmex zeteki]
MPTTARKRRFSRRRSCYLGSHSRRSVCYEDEEKKVKEEEIPREFAEFIPAISARQARRFDASANFSAERKRFNVISVIKKGSVSWRYLMKCIALKLYTSVNNIFFKNITFIVALKIMFVSDYGLESRAWNVSSIVVGRARGIFTRIQNPRTNIKKTVSHMDIIILIEVLKRHFNNNRIINLNIARSIWINRFSQRAERERERERERDLCEGGSKQRRLPLLVYAREVIAETETYFADFDKSYFSEGLKNSTTAVYNKTNSNYKAAGLPNTNIRLTHNQKVSSFESGVGKSVEEPLEGITPPALTQSGSEAYLAIERIQGYNLTWKRIAAGFMYQEDGGSGRLSPSGQSMGSSIKFTLRKTRLPRHAACLLACVTQHHRWTCNDVLILDMKTKKFRESLKSYYKNVMIATPLIDVTGIVLIARLLSASKAGFLTASW